MSDSQPTQERRPERIKSSARRSTWSLPWQESRSETWRYDIVHFTPKDLSISVSPNYSISFCWDPKKLLLSHFPVAQAADEAAAEIKLINKGYLILEFSMEKNAS